MQTRKNSITLFTLLIGIVIINFTACKKYEEGGSISKADKTIINTWQLDSYYRNGTDETSLIYISSYSEQYSENGTYTRTYVDKNGDTDTETGEWALQNDNLEVHISDISSINDFSSANNSLSSSIFTILKLTDDEYWYTFENGSDNHEFHLIK